MNWERHGRIIKNVDDRDILWFALTAHYELRKPAMDFHYLKKCKI
jgi:hypothetical protein